MMRALLQNANSGPNDSSHYGDLSVLKLEQTAKTTSPPSSTDVIIRVHACALNPIDLKRVSIALDPKFPVIVGYDVAGTVQAVGSDVKNVSIGDSVYGNLLANTLGPKETGSIAEYAVSKANLLDKIPDNISFVQAAALPLVAQTAIQALRLAGTKEGDSVFVSAGSGGVGIHLFQIAKHLFKVGKLATTCSAAKIEFVKKHGADICIDYKTQKAGEVLAQWADVIVDCTAEYEMERKICKPGGKIVSIIQPAKPDVEWCLVKPSEADMSAVSALVKKELLTPVLDSIHSLDNVTDAVNRQASGRASGKVVIKILD